ncbi:MAG: ATP-binding protein, partial [Lachnospiraceae bacterium]|nr:ATP-binding protein [Lachnospiraceae bacterium]
MKLSLKNVGKIKEADIELNGITVIGGENNTGKSTIGKMLYCVFHSFYRIEDQILDERKKTINRVLINFYRETSNRYMYRFNTGEIIEDVLENREFYLKDLKSLENKLADFYNAADERFSQSSDSISFNELAIKIADYLNITDDEI